MGMSISETKTKFPSNELYFMIRFFHTVHVTQILREIIFNHFRVSKIAVFEAMNFYFGQIQPSKKGKNISKSKFTASKNVKTAVFEHLECLKLISRCKSNYVSKTYRGTQTHRNCTGSLYILLSRPMQLGCSPL